MEQHNKLNQRGFKVRIEGVTNMEDDDDEIEEDIQTDRDDPVKNIGNGLTESGGNYGTGITVS
jgi:hypothetical protein